MSPVVRVLARVAAALVALAWVLAGAFVGLEYGLADAGTSRADAPALAAYCGYLLPLAGGALVFRAALLAGGDDAIGVRRSVAGAAACLAGWVVALVVLSGY